LEDATKKSALPLTLHQQCRQIHFGSGPENGPRLSIGFVKRPNRPFYWVGRPAQKLPKLPKKSGNFGNLLGKAERHCPLWQKL